jgi:hypothetical protein
LDEQHRYDERAQSSANRSVHRSLAVRVLCEAFDAARGETLSVMLVAPVLLASVRAFAFGCEVTVAPVTATP